MNTGCLSHTALCHGTHPQVKAGGGAAVLETIAKPRIEHKRLQDRRQAQAGAPTRRGDVRFAAAHQSPHVQATHSGLLDFEECKCAISCCAICAMNVVFSVKSHATGRRLVRSREANIAPPCLSRTAEAASLHDVRCTSIHSQPASADPHQIIESAAVHLFCLRSGLRPSSLVSLFSQPWVLLCSWFLPEASLTWGVGETACGSAGFHSARR